MVHRSGAAAGSPRPYSGPDGLNAMVVFFIPAAQREYHASHDRAWKAASIDYLNHLISIQFMFRVVIVGLMP
jgi:hypothetical protein